MRRSGPKENRVQILSIIGRAPNRRGEKEKTTGFCQGSARKGEKKGTNPNSAGGNVPMS